MGGQVDCGAIHRSDIPRFPYDLLRGERAVFSGANLIREDARTFFEFVPQAGIVTHTRAYPLAQANAAIAAHPLRWIKVRVAHASEDASVTSPGRA